MNECNNCLQKKYWAMLKDVQYVRNVRNVQNVHYEQENTSVSIIDWGGRLGIVSTIFFAYFAHFAQ